MKKLIKHIKGIYHDIYKYIHIPPFWLRPLKDDEDDWFIKNKIIPHALGKIEEFCYTNSFEAYKKWYSVGYRVFEADISLTKDFIPVLSHKNLSNIDCKTFLNTKIEGRFSPLSLFDFIDIMRRDNIFVLLDIKEGAEEFVCEFLKQNAFDIIDNFIIQIPSKRAFQKIVKIHRFKYFHYNFSIDGNVNYRLHFVVKNNIKTCSVALHNVKNKRTLRYLNKFNIKPYIYTVNDKKTQHDLLQKGAYGIISDELE